MKLFWFYIFLANDFSEVANGIQFVKYCFLGNGLQNGEKQHSLVCWSDLIQLALRPLRLTLRLDLRPIRLAFRPLWLTLGPSGWPLEPVQLALGPLQLVIGLLQLALRPLRMALRRLPLALRPVQLALKTPVAGHQTPLTRPWNPQASSKTPTAGLDPYERPSYLFYRHTLLTGPQNPQLSLAFRLLRLALTPMAFRPLRLDLRPLRLALRPILLVRLLRLGLRTLQLALRTLQLAQTTLAVVVLIDSWGHYKCYNVSGLRPSATFSGKERILSIYFIRFLFFFSQR